MVFEDSSLISSLYCPCGRVPNFKPRGSNLSTPFGKSDMGVEPKIGVVNPPKWMVYFMENLIEMDDLGGTPIFGNNHIRYTDL